MKKAIITTLCLLTNFAFASIETKEFSADGLKTLKIKNTSGNVKIAVSADNKAYVNADKIKFEKNCTLTIEKTDTDLLVEVDNEGWGNNDNCKVNFEIKVPKEIALNLKSGSGNFDVNGTKGTVNFKLGSGNTKINAEVENLDAKSGSGSIEITGLSGSADLKTGSGNITLSYSTAPTKGALDIKTGSGDATVYLPASTKVLTKFKAGSGEIYNELGDTSNAPFTVSMKAGSGDLKLKKL